MLEEVELVGNIVDLLRYFEGSDVLGAELLTGLGISDVFGG